MSACAGGGPKDALPPLGETLKLSYFRAYPNPRTKKPDPTYRVILSNTWKARVGEGSREPFPRAAPDKNFKGFLPDDRLREILQRVQSMGIERLQWKNPDEFNPQDLHAKALHSVESEFTRIITIGTDTWARSYYYRENQLSAEHIETFRECEKFVSRVMDSNTMEVKIRAPAVFQQDR